MPPGPQHGLLHQVLGPLPVARAQPLRGRVQRLAVLLVQRPQQRRLMVTHQPGPFPPTSTPTSEHAGGGGAVHSVAEDEPPLSVAESLLASLPLTSGASARAVACNRSRSCLAECMKSRIGNAQPSTASLSNPPSEITGTAPQATPGLYCPVSICIPRLRPAARSASNAAGSTRVASVNARIPDSFRYRSRRCGSSSDSIALPMAVAWAASSKPGIRSSSQGEYGPSATAVMVTRPPTSRAR